MLSPTALIACRASRWRVCVRGSDEGQSTVEFAVVCAALVCVAAALAAIWHLFDGGRVLGAALASASHHVGAGDAGAWGDILAY